MPPWPWYGQPLRTYGADVLDNHDFRLCRDPPPTPGVVNIEQFGWIGAGYHFGHSRTGRKGAQCLPLTENLGVNRSHRNQTFTKRHSIR